MGDTETTENGAGEAVLPAQGHAQTISILFLGVVMVALDIAILGPALPAIQREFRLSPRHLPWIFGVYILLNLVGRPVLGRLSDLLGRRMVFAGSALLYGLGALTSFLAPSFQVLLLGRAISGFGNGGIFPVASAAVTDFLPPERRPGILHLMGSVVGFAFLVGVPLGGAVMVVGWRWIFAGAVVVSLVVALSAVSAIPSTPRPKAPHLDTPAVVILFLLLSALALGINTLDTTDVVASFKSVRIWPLFAMAAVLWIILVAMERRAEEPFIRPSALGKWRMQLGGLVVMGAGVLEMGMVCLPIYALLAFGYTERTAWLSMVPLLVAMAVATPLTQKLGGKRGTRVVISGGALLAGLGLAGMGSIATGEGMFRIAGAFVGAGMAGLLSPSLRHKAIADVKEEDHFKAQRAIFVFITIGRLVGAALVGAFAGSGDDILAGFRNAYLALGAAAGVVFLLSLFLRSPAAAAPAPAPAPNGN